MKNVRCSELYWIKLIEFEEKNLQNISEKHIDYEDVLAIKFIWVLIYWVFFSVSILSFHFHVFRDATLS